MGNILSWNCCFPQIDTKVLRSHCFKCGKKCSKNRDDLFLLKIIHWGKHNGKIICSDCLYIT